jgi:hypothetical protein
MFADKEEHTFFKNPKQSHHVRATLGHEEECGAGSEEISS